MADIMGRVKSMIAGVKESSAFGADKSSRIASQAFDRKRFQGNVSSAVAGTAAPARMSGSSSAPIKGPQFTSTDTSMSYGPRVSQTLPTAPPRV
jgi:hypothetical protein